MSDVYFELTITEILRLWNGYQKRETEAWRRTRWLGLKVIEPYLDKNKNINVFDLLPLPGDPTKQEMEEAQKEQARKNKEYRDNLVEHYIKLGIMTRTEPTNKN